MNENCGMYTGASEHFSLELHGLSKRFSDNLSHYSVQTWIIEKV